MRKGEKGPESNGWRRNGILSRCIAVVERKHKYG